MWATLRAVRRFLADEGGPTAVEYAVMLCMIIIVCIIAIKAIGAPTAASFGEMDRRYPR